MVLVCKGSDLGKTGAVLRVLPAEGKIVIDGVNVRTLHRKPRMKGEKGSIEKKPMPINASNVAVVDPKTKKRTRIRYSGTGREKQRVTKSGAILKRETKRGKK